MKEADELGNLCRELLITFSIKESMGDASASFFDSTLVFITDWNELRICADVGDCFACGSEEEAGDDRSTPACLL